MAEVLLKRCQQDMALRGHREDCTSQNKGNFREWLDVIANHDDIIMKKLQSGSQNATQNSPDIQNTLLNIMADMVRNSICLSVQQAQMFSLLVDETKDISKVEQMSINVSYVDNNTSLINERFLTFYPAKDLTAESIF